MTSTTKQKQAKQEYRSVDLEDVLGYVESYRCAIDAAFESAGHPPDEHAFDVLATTVDALLDAMAATVVEYRKRNAA